MEFYSCNQPATGVTTGVIVIFGHSLMTLFSSFVGSPKTLELVWDFYH
jgi:hypothetical protein